LPCRCLAAHFAHAKPLQQLQQPLALILLPLAVHSLFYAPAAYLAEIHYAAALLNTRPPRRTLPAKHIAFRLLAKHLFVKYATHSTHHTFIAQAHFL
jgi:hypothetical protein